MKLHPACKICKKDPTILYVLKKKVWENLFGKFKKTDTLTLSSTGGVICIECIKNLLNRDLEIKDFDLGPSGNDFIFAHPWVLHFLNEGNDLTKACISYLQWYVKTFDDIPYFGHYLGKSRIKENFIINEDYVNWILWNEQPPPRNEFQQLKQIIHKIP